MSELDHTEYCRRREAAERAMADRSADPHVAQIHRALADRYALQAHAAPVMA